MGIKTDLNGTFAFGMHALGIFLFAWWVKFNVLVYGATAGYVAPREYCGDKNNVRKILEPIYYTVPFLGLTPVPRLMESRKGTQLDFSPQSDVQTTIPFISVQSRHIEPRIIVIYGPNIGRGNVHCVDEVTVKTSKS